MTPEQMRDAVLQRCAILSELNRIGLRVIEGCEDEVTKWFASKGVTCDLSAGFLQMRQADGSEAIPSQACLTLRREKPELFASSVKYDAISSREDFNRGTHQEQVAARTEYIRKFGLVAFETLPRTHAEAQLKSVEIGPGMTRREYLSLSLAEKSRLLGTIGGQAVAVIMNRKG
jgi:hypothetical protein